MQFDYEEILPAVIRLWVQNEQVLICLEHLHEKSYSPYAEWRSTNIQNFF